MDRSIAAKVAGAIVLGALGSALWEMAKPVSAFAWNAALSVATLGLDSLRDALYESAARQGVVLAKQSLSMQLLGATIAGVTGVTLIVLADLHRPANAPPGRRKKLLTYATAFVAATTLLVLAAMRTAYIARVAAYHDYLSIAAAPHLDERTRLVLASRAALSKTRSQYVGVLGELEAVLRQRGVRFDAIDPF